MSNYVREVQIEVQFDGATVKLRLRPLTRGDMFQLQALLSVATAARPGDKDGAAAFTFYADQLPGYVVNCTGVLDSDGVVVPVEEWTKAAYHLGLVGEVMAAHMAKAVPANPA